MSAFTTSSTAIRSKRMQCTLAESISLSGLAIFSGKTTSVTLVPQQENYGIWFKRVDLPESPLIEAVCDNVISTKRTTTLGDADGLATVSMVEHLLSALRAMQIDNVLIEVDGPEIPICDGSSQEWVKLIEETNTVQQVSLARVDILRQPLYLSESNVNLVALPANEFKVSYTLCYPGHPLLDAQFFSSTVTKESFKCDICMSRTFVLYEEVLPFLENGTLNNAGLEHGVVVKQDGVMNKEGMRFQNEMARHKVLDLIGDLSLVGKHFYAHIIAISSGHTTNVEFAKMLKASLQKGEV